MARLCLIRLNTRLFIKRTFIEKKTHRIVKMIQCVNYIYKAKKFYILNCDAKQVPLKLQEHDIFYIHRKLKGCQNARIYLTS